MKIRQLTQCDTMVGVGSSIAIARYTLSYSRNNVCFFNASTGTVTDWNPNVIGVLNSIVLPTDLASAHPAGKFSSVHDTAAQNFATSSTTPGAVITSLAHSAASRAEAVFVNRSHVLVSGDLPGINNSTKKYVVGLNSSTGRDDGYTDVNLSGNYVDTYHRRRSAAATTTRIYNFALSPDGSRLLVMGDFTSVAAAPSTDLHARPRRYGRHLGCGVSSDLNAGSAAPSNASR